MLLAPSTFLSRSLALDALATGATALLLALGAGYLEPMLGLPAALMRWAGALLVPFVAVVAFAATRERLPAGLVWAIILCNAAWVAASVALLAGSWVHPTWLGTAFVIAQATVVGIFAQLQLVGLRRSAALA